MGNASKSLYLTVLVMNTGAYERVHFLTEGQREVFANSKYLVKERSVVIRRGQSFSKLVDKHVGYYYSFNHSEVLKAYKKANPHIQDLNLINEGDILNHPSYVAKSKYDELYKVLKVKDDESSNLDIQRHFTFGYGYSLTGIESFDKRNSSKSTLISSGEFNYKINLGFNVNNEHRFDVGFERRTYNLEDTANATIDGDIPSSTYFRTQYLYNVYKSLSIGGSFNFGTDVFKISSGGNITHESVNAMSYGVTLNYNLFSSDKLTVDTSASYLVRSLQSTELDITGGNEYDFRFYAQMPINEKVSIGNEIFFYQRHDETAIYNQTLRGNGVLLNLKVGF